MRHAYFRDAKASYNDIVWWPKGAGWQNQSLDVDTSVHYLYIFSNTKDDGPIVLEVPAAVAGAKFLGTILDTWQVPLTDVGVDGQAAKYLILPPDYTGDVPTGYIPLRPKTYNPATNAGMTIARLEAHRGPVGLGLRQPRRFLAQGHLTSASRSFFQNSV